MPRWTKTRVPFEQTWKSSFVKKKWSERLSLANHSGMIVFQALDGTCLSLSEEVRHESTLNSIRDVGVVEDDERTLPSKLQGHVANANRT